MSNLLPDTINFVSQHPEVFTTAGAFFAGAYADAAKDLAGLVGGNQLKAWSLAQMENILKKAQDKNRGSGIENQPISPSVGVPLLQAAAMEQREELVELWVSLLAAAMDPRRAKDVRQSYIDTIKQMDPTDALVFNAMKSGESRPYHRDRIAEEIGKSHREVEVSFLNLLSLRCVYAEGTQQMQLISMSIAVLTAKGHELKRLLSS